MNEDSIDSLRYLVYLLARLHDEVKVERMKIGDHKYTVITTPLVPEGEIIFGVDMGKGGDYTAVSLLINGKVVG